MLFHRMGAWKSSYEKRRRYNKIKGENPLHAHYLLGDTPLHSACNVDDLEGFEFVLANGGDVNESRLPTTPFVPIGDRILHLVAQKGNIRMAQLLVEGGVDTSALN